MKIQLAMLLTDWLIYLLAVIALIVIAYIRRHPHLSEPWRRMLQRKSAMISMVILACYVIIGLVDSIHFEVTQKADGLYVSTRTESLFDLLVGSLAQHEEKTFSAPFSIHLHSKSLITLPNGKEIQGYPRLQYAGSYLKNENERGKDIGLRVVMGIMLGIVTFIPIFSVWLWILVCRHRKKIITIAAWREAMLTFFIIWIFTWILILLARNYHILGTDQVGRDVFYEALKSIRTGLLIGILTTLFMLPFALILGMLAGYFSGWVDDIIQYLYTTLSSIPGVLLITATILVLQVYIDSHPQAFPTIAQRADARLLALCFILGVTSWASLCRLLRGETLKLREQEFVQASRSLGAGSFRILVKHIMPNVVHIVLITVVLDFSLLVLAEAVLSYVGVGVDPTTISWGNMINSARLQLAREPMIWWPLVAAFIFMFILVLAANVYADAVRDALDPRLRKTE